MLELKFATCHRVAEVGPHRQQASLVDVSLAYGYLTTDSFSGRKTKSAVPVQRSLRVYSIQICSILLRHTAVT